MKFFRTLPRLLAASAVALCASFAPERAAAQDPYLSEMRLFASNFCPRGWLTAEGQILAISQYTALFSLLGTTYGGDGRTTFGLPDLRGRTPIGQGNAPGGSSYGWGARGGQETVTLTVPEMPAHSHSLNATNSTADQRRPNGDILAFPDYVIDGTPLRIYGNGSPEVQMEPSSIGVAGGNLAHENRMPYMSMYWCIAVQGTFPSRN